MSSKENEIVIQHQKDLLEVFGSVLDERIGMKHSRYVIDDYFRQFFNLRKWIDHSSKYIRDNGFIYSHFGRKRRLPKWY